jgi:hypothetical protein
MALRVNVRPNPRQHSPMGKKRRGDAPRVRPAGQPTATLPSLWLVQTFPVKVASAMAAYELAWERVGGGQLALLFD